MNKTNTQERLLLIGGYPKGYHVPFHPDTLSGKRLWKILNEYKGTIKLMDLWNNEREEQDGQVSYVVANEIGGHIWTGWRVIALGRHVWNCLQKHSVDVEYLPHPASRRKKDLQKLKRGLLR